MSKFKVGDKVALVNTPNVYFGCIASIGHDDAFVKVPPNYDCGFLVRLVELALYKELPDMSDDEIYNMLKPKLDNDDILQYEYYYDEIIKSIALAYRSGYLRAKEGRSFKIGGEKD